MTYKTDLQRQKYVAQQLQKIQDELYSTHIETLNSQAAGNEPFLMPDAYTAILDALSQAFNENLASSNGLAIGGTVMDQLIVGLAKPYLMAANFPKNVMDALNPNTATGAARRMLALMSDVPIQEGTPTTVKLQVIGVPNTQISALSLLIKPLDRTTQYYNLNNVTLDDNGLALVEFVAQNWGVEILVPEESYKIMTTVTGITEVKYNIEAGSEISIGQIASTDQQIKDNMLETLNGRAKNGPNSVLDSLIKLVPSANSIVTAFNGESFVITYPANGGITQLPSNSLIVSLSCEETSTTSAQIAEALHANYTFATNYPVNCPAGNQKITSIQANGITYYYKWVRPTPIVVEFTLTIHSPHEWYNVDDSDLKEAILKQFDEGGGNWQKVVQGIPFYLKGFDNAISSKGLPSYNITMNFIQQPVSKILCSFLWEKPVTSFDNITITWENPNVN